MQELMRHSTIRVTLDTNTQAVTSEKRAAQTVSLILRAGVVGGAILIALAGQNASESTLISVPIVAISMGVETALVDAIFFRVLLKSSVRAQSGALLIANILNATIALALGLACAYVVLHRDGGSLT